MRRRVTPTPRKEEAAPTREEGSGANAGGGGKTASRKEMRREQAGGIGWVWLGLGFWAGGGFRGFVQFKGRKIPPNSRNKIGSLFY